MFLETYPLHGFILKNVIPNLVVFSLPSAREILFGMIDPFTSISQC
jgi:hypothetical protein